MPNKYYSNLVSDYFVEGKGKEGYLKKGKGWQNMEGSTPNRDYGENHRSDEGQNKDWFQGKKSKVGVRYQENFKRE